MGQSWIILLPTILTIIVCLATKKIFVGMFVGIFSGCIILAGGNPLAGLGMSFDKLIAVVSSAWNVKLILFATLIGGMIKLMQVSGAVNGLIQWLQKKAKITTPAKAQFLTWLIGVVLFFDQYTSEAVTATIGKTLANNYGYSREKVAYLVDSTASPMCALLPLNSWGAYIIGLLATLGGQYALVIGTEALSRLMDPADRSTCVLFGDGAGAAVFELTDTSVPFAITLGARGDAAIHAGGPSRAGSAPISMDGRAVFRFAVDALPKCLHTVLDETGLTLDNLDWVVCHQANSRIIDHCVKALHADGAKFYKNMDRHGNTSAASIPVALNELAESGQLHPGQTLACIGFGGGLTWGGMIVEYKG